MKTGVCGSFCIMGYDTGDKDIITILKYLQPLGIF